MRKFFRFFTHTIMGTTAPVFLTPVMKTDLEKGSQLTLLREHVFDDEACACPTLTTDDPLDELDYAQAMDLLNALLEGSGLKEAAEAAARFRDGVGEAGSAAPASNGEGVRVPPVRNRAGARR